MSKKEFNPTEYKNKKTITKSIPGYSGVSQIMTWSDRRKRYCNKTIGNKYYAAKRIGGVQVTKTFARLNEAKKWQVDEVIEVEENDEDLLFKDVKKKFLKRKKLEIRVATYESLVSKIKHLKFFEKYRMSEVTPKLIDSWLLHVKTPSYLKTQHKTRFFYKHELFSFKTNLCLLF